MTKEPLMLRFSEDVTYFIKWNSSVTINEGEPTYYFIPMWFKETDIDNVFEYGLLSDAPTEIKNIILNYTEKWQQK
jgi:uncharacterized protein YegJ (DUF2314 family)